ncbi:thioesterase II family protein [Paractinoplanes hotanensis]|uniref:Thioesterase domain-containing protein n=1 Tax=Paractinoplanes hotanensis TaxID=2906497 RepID=A0ABT0YBE0_9ACTN|nr:thioesterase domain-containing protein [Actinoplanes hotanensis]MCM4083115.1 thioesterase domain-containing protein [Actinoplanes hotanensis]
MIVSTARRQGGRWLLHPPAPDSARRLFCLPYLGAGASMYHRWPRMIGDTEVCLLQPPGRENRLVEAPHETYPAFAGDAFTALRPLLDRPYTIFAHCNSVFAGLALVLHMMTRGAPAPRRFVASSMVAPDEVPFGGVLDVPEEELPGVVTAMMRARGLTPTPEMVELAMDAVRGDLRAYRDFRGLPPGPLPFPVTVLRWQDDGIVPPALTAGWRRFGEVREVDLPGDHWAMLEPGPEMLTVLND